MRDVYKLKRDERLAIEALNEQSVGTLFIVTQSEQHGDIIELGDINRAEFQAWRTLIPNPLEDQDKVQEPDDDEQ